MEAKHTQGPWEFANANTVLVGPKIDDKPIWLRPVVLRAETAIRSEDASLIAAAPDLLEALQNICDEQDAQQGHATPETYDKARAAIAKAQPLNARIQPETRAERTHK